MTRNRAPRILLGGNLVTADGILPEQVAPGLTPSARAATAVPLRVSTIPRAAILRNARPAAVRHSPVTAMTLSRRSRTLEAQPPAWELTFPFPTLCARSRTHCPSHGFLAALREEDA
jgi:hypothetical protein